MTRIAIVEDDPLLGASLRQTIASIDGFSVVGWVQTLAAGRRLLEQTPELLLVDLGLPDGSGLDLISEATALGTTKSLALSVFGDVRHVVQAIERGAEGYLLKGAESFEVSEALQIVLDGGAPISPAVAGHILSRMQRSAPPPKLGGEQSLTAREIEVLQLLAKGCASKEVATTLGLSYHTVADYVKTIYRKLAVNSRTEAVFEAAQAGLIRLHDS